MKLHCWLLGIGSGLLVLPLFTTVASAHVVVKPSQVGVASEQIFSMSVPNERQSPVTELRLLIPSGLRSISPTVKPGWTIVTKPVNAANDQITEIDWTGGLIPVGQRDDFSFSAQAPATATTLAWKVYQTYQDGTVVHWDQVPSDKETDNDAVTAGPYSKTTVINDLTPATKSSATQPAGFDQVADWSGIVALVLSMVALYLGWRRTTHGI